MSHEHNLLLVVAAGIICAITALSTAYVLRFAGSADESRRWWLVGAMLVIGFGIWTTHFVAMLGFEGHGDVRFMLGSTVLSLVAGLAGAFLSLRFVEHEQGKRRSAMTGLGIALSTSALHYVGMNALVMDHVIAWNLPMVALSIVSGACLAVPAFVLMLSPRATIATSLKGAGLLAASVLALHFIGMDAMRMTMRPAVIETHDIVVSRDVLAVALAAISLLIIGWLLTLLALDKRKDREERARLRELRMLMDGVNDTAIYMLDPHGHVMTWNMGAERLKQYRADEIIGQHFSRFYPPEDRNNGKPHRALEEAREQGVFRDFGPRLRKDGESFHASITIEPIYANDGSLHGFAKITRDLTRFRTVEQQLDVALENMQQGLLLLNADKRLVLHNKRFPQLYHLKEDPLKPGMHLDEIIRLTVGQCLKPERMAHGLKRAGEIYDELLQGHQEHSMVGASDEGDYHSLSACALEDGGWVITVEDITDRQQAALRLEHMATHDSLTGLPNRDRFASLMQETLDRARVQQERVAVAILDLDNFKEVNDVHGHSAGDEVLHAVALRLQQAIGDTGHAARLGGDEFAVFQRLGTTETLDDVGRRLADAVCFSCTPHRSILGEKIDFSGSVGLALFPEDGTRTRDLMANADLAMYRAKASPLSRWSRFLPEMDEEIREKRSLQAELRQALERREFHIVYQVQCSVSDGSVIGYEALLRWEHGRLGSVPPSDFIEPAEESGLIVPIGEWVMRQVCKEAASWQKPYKVAVNVSPVQLVQPNLPTIVTEALVQSGLSPKRLEIEITESAIIADKLRALHNLRQIKALGVSVAIDDFGTGYSSLDTLNSFSFDKIKIDRSFLMGIHKDAQSRNIVKAVLGLGKSLNLPVLAEGVETAEDLAILREENCQEAQGFYFGRPGKVDFSEDGGPAREVIVTADEPRRRIA